MSEMASGLERPRGGKGREAFRTISEVADELDLPQHVLRFWESKFTQIKPLKRGGNRRYYRPDDVTLLMAIKKLLHADGYTIRGVQKLFKAQGVKTTIYEALEMEDPSSVAEPQAFQADQPAEPPAVHVAVAEQGDGAEKDLKEVLASLKALRARLG